MDEALRREREYTWLGLLALGVTINEIAAAYEVSVPTVYAVTRAGRQPFKPLNQHQVLSLANQFKSLPLEHKHDLIKPDANPRNKLATHYLYRLLSDLKNANVQLDSIQNLVEVDPENPSRYRLKAEIDLHKRYPLYGKEQEANTHA